MAGINFFYAEAFFRTRKKFFGTRKKIFVRKFFWVNKKIFRVHEKILPVTKIFHAKKFLKPDLKNFFCLQKNFLLFLERRKFY
jgi:hypothetical protein